MTSGSYLSLQEREVPASSEWSVTPTAWRLIHLGHGVGYCLGSEPPRELSTADVLVMRPGSTVLLRASQLGPMRLHYFDFQPELLNWLLSLSERQRLQILVTAPDREVHYLSMTDPVAAEFMALCETRSDENQLLERCRLLTLAATLLKPKLAPAHQPGPTHGGVPPKFLDLVQKMPELEVLNHASEELARLCGCSLRHFTRLFRKHFGASLRTKQTQWRLEKARQLLCETDAQVAKVALDSGYRHVGLFNMMFKNHFGLTPTEMRLARKKKQRVRSLVPAALLFLLSSLQLLADPVTGSGTLTAKASMTDSSAFAVKEDTIEGDTR
jgi:AraC-like DNA-binding protein